MPKISTVLLLVMMSCPDSNVPDCTVSPIYALERRESAHLHSILVISTKQQQHYCKITCFILSKTKMLTSVPFKSTRATTHLAFPSKGQIPSRELIWISSTNYKPQASLHQQQLNVLFSYYKSPSKLLPSLSHPDRFIILPNQFILGQTIVFSGWLQYLAINGVVESWKKRVIRAYQSLEDILANTVFSGIA